MCRDNSIPLCEKEVSWRTDCCANKGHISAYAQKIFGRIDSQVSTVYSPVAKGGSRCGWKFKIAFSYLTPSCSDDFFLTSTIYL